MKTLILSSVLVLSGCASNCYDACLAGFGPGNSAFDRIAKHYNDNDPCILAGKPEGTTRPNFCGASAGKSISITKSIYPNSYLVNVR